MSQIKHSLKNKIIITSPKVFNKTVSGNLIYIFLHNDLGAMGISINKPIGQFYENNFLKKHSKKDRLKEVYLGGELNLNYGIVIHTSDFFCKSTICISNSIYLSAANDVIKELSMNKGPKMYLFAIGCKYWKENSLEKEVKKNNWMCIEATEKILFKKKGEEKWMSAIEEFGIKNPYVIAKNATLLI